MKKWYPKEKVIYYVKQPIELNNSEDKPHHHHIPSTHFQRGKKKHASRVLQQIQNILTPSYVEKLVTKPVNPDPKSEPLHIRIDSFGFSPSSMKIQANTLVRFQNSSSNTFSQHELAGLSIDLPVLKDGDSFDYMFSEPGTFELYRTSDPAIKCRIDVLSEVALKHQTPEKIRFDTITKELSTCAPANLNEEFSLDSVIQNEILKELSNPRSFQTATQDSQALRKTSSKKKANWREAKKQKKQELGEIILSEARSESEEQRSPSVFDTISKDQMSFDTFLKLRSKEILRLEDLAHPTKISFTEKELRDTQLAKNFLQTSKAFSTIFLLINRFN